MDFSFVSFDPEKRSCVVMRMSHDRFQLSEMAGNLLFEATAMSTLEWRHDDQKYGEIHIYSAPYSRPPHTYTPHRSHLPVGHGSQAAPTPCPQCWLLVASIADDPSFIEHFFSGLNTPAIDNFVCKTMRDSCPDVWAANDLNSLGDCEAKLAALPLAEGDDFYIDSNTCASPRA